jgi:Sec-independent protein translocase protein TatA
VAIGKLKPWNWLWEMLAGHLGRAMKSDRRNGSITLNELDILMFSVRKFDEAIQSVHDLISDIRSAVTRIKNTANSDEALQALQNARGQTKFRSHEDLAEMKNSMSQDAEEFRMDWKSIIEVIGSIGDTKSQTVMESWGRDIEVDAIVTSVNPIMTSAAS